MSVDENLHVFMNTKTKLVPLEQVSSGTMDQVYLALRLASAKLIQKGDDSLPLIFDDSFVPVSYTHLDVYKRQFHGSKG